MISLTAMTSTLFSLKKQIKGYSKLSSARNFVRKPNEM
jgi:hypothetical protein